MAKHRKAGVQFPGDWTTAGSAFQRISPPNAQASVRVHGQVLESLRREAARALTTARNSELSGILLGRNSNGTPPEITVETFERGKANTDAGSRAADGDLMRLLRQWRGGPDRELYAVGFYRVTSECELTGYRDYWLLRSYLSGPAVALFIDPRNAESARMFVIEDAANPAGVGNPVEVRLDETEATARPAPVPSVNPGPQRLSSHPGASPAPVEPPLHTEVAEGSDTPSELVRERNAAGQSVSGSIRRKRPQFLVLAGIIALTGLLLASAAMIRSRIMTAPASAILGLKLDRTGTDYRLTWDRNAPAVLDAQGGVLSIWQGSERKDIKMETSQLRAGMLLYVAPIGDLTFQLEVFGRRSPPVIESIQVVNGASRVASASETDPSTEWLSWMGLQRSPSAARSNRAPVRSSDDRKAPDDRETPEAKPQPDAEQPLVAVFRPPPEKRATGLKPSDNLPVPPAFGEIRGVTDPSDAGSLIQTSVSALPEPPRPQQAEATGPATTPSPAPIATQPSPDLTQSRLPSDYVPPRAMRQGLPVIPANVKLLLPRGTEVPILVSIDSSGRVVGAVPTRSESGVRSVLAQAAVRAVKEWRFTPATLRSKPIRSELHVTFHFGPASSTGN